MYLIPVPAFANNYLWLLHDGKRALVVDPVVPGDTEPVLRTLAQHGLQLESILVTHPHADHTGARAVEPDTADLIAYQARFRHQHNDKQPKLPTAIAQELLVNPFLRTRQAPIMAAARRFDASTHDDNAVFAAIRQWKNQFK
jgi:glyoxylase-like metal-dependent hydrolase (beta-lactamase superfamily II)